MIPDDAPSAVDLAHTPPFRIGSLEVRPSTREIMAGDRSQVLEPRIMQVLVGLARRRGEVVSRDDLIASCWGGRVVGDDAIDRCIGAIRRLAQTYGGFSVETIVRVGYRLNEANGEREPAQRPSFWRRPRAGPRAWAVAALAALVVAASGAWLLRDRLRPAEKAHEIRVAVLPFDVLSPGQNLRYFADGLRDEILGVLSSNQVLAVSRNESLALRGPNSRQGIDRLGVGLLLDGTVQRNGENLRVRLHVDDARAHVTLWSRDFEGPAKDADVLQARVAGSATIVTNWLVSDRYGLGAKIDRATLAAYLEAGDELDNRGGDRAIPILRQIVARAPDFSYGHSALALALAISAVAAPDAERPALLAETRTEARRALDLDPRNGEGYLALAMLTPPHAWQAREGLISKGLSIDPTSPYLPAIYSTLLADLGRSREALAMQQRGVAAAPYWPRGQAYLVRRLADQGRIGQARATAARTARLWPENNYVSQTRFRLAMESAPAALALSLLEESIARPSGTFPAAADVWRTFLRARDTHDKALRSRAAQSLVEAADAAVVDSRAAVAGLAMLGDVDAAFSQAEGLRSLEGQARPYGLDDTTSVLFAPITRPLRQDPRFMPLAASLGLVAYWRATGRWPDFCAEPGLPYDCKVEAAKLAQVRG